MLIRTHVGVSLDGFVSTSQGFPTWEALRSFDGDSHGYTALMAQTEAIIVGRTSFDQGFDDWLTSWPWPDKTVHVLTSRPLPANVPAGVVAATGGPAALVEQLRRAGLTRDVHLLGGSRTIRAFFDIGAIDQFGLCVLPVLLGKGIPLFDLGLTTFSRDTWAAAQRAPGGPSKMPSARLRLEQHRVFPDGAVALVYQKESDLA